VIGFERLIEDYESCPDFSFIFHSFQGDQLIRSKEYVLHNGYLFRGTRLCLPATLMRLSDLEDAIGGIPGHFGRDKTIALVEDRFY